LKLTIHLHLMLRAKISGGIPLLPVCFHGMHRNNFTLLTNLWNDSNEQIIMQHGVY